MRVLIISRTVWDDTSGLSSTLSSIFRDFNPNDLAHIFIETKVPNTCHCKRFFSISEYSLVRKLVKWKTKTGRTLSYDAPPSSYIDNSIQKKEEKVFDLVRRHRSNFFTLSRELLWAFNGWKTKELDAFVQEFSPDIIWFDGSPLILMNRLALYISRKTKAPMVSFMMDDVYSYKACNTIGDKFHRLFLRAKVRKVVSLCDRVFVISPKMKKEYDSVFKINSTIITKSIDFTRRPFKEYKPHKPLRLVYLGQIIYGRKDSIVALVDAMREINKEKCLVALSIYTNSDVPKEYSTILNESFVTFHPCVPYEEVSSIIEENDCLLYIESFEKRSKSLARLSFSTKITDYLSSSKCIFAIGPDDIAPIEYFIENDAAVIARSKEDIPKCLYEILEDGQRQKYAKRAYELGMRNHSAAMIDQTVSEALNSVCRNNNRH